MVFLFVLNLFADDLKSSTAAIINVPVNPVLMWEGITPRDSDLHVVQSK